MTAPTFVTTMESQPPAEVLDAIYDDLVRIRPSDRPFELLARWIGASCIRFVSSGEAMGHHIANELTDTGMLEVEWPPGHIPDRLQLDRIRTASDHVARALSYRERLLETRNMYEICASGLDRLSFGAMTLHESGHPVDANRAARAILARRDGLAIIDGKVCATHPADHRAMRQLIDAVMNGEIEQGAMKVQRASGEPDLHLLIICRPPRDAVIRAGVRMLVRDPSAPTLHSASALSGLYGLTEAEAAITLELANGNSPQDVEEMFSIRHNTMRAHLRAIYAKLCVGSHAELIYTVLTGAAALAFDDPADFEPLEPLNSLMH